MSNGAPKTPVSPLHWDMILESIHNGSCVPFLGAAVNISSSSRAYDGLPLGPDVALSLIGKLIGTPVREAKELAEVKVVSQAFEQQGLHEDLGRLWIQNLPRVALHVQVQGQDRQYLNGRLKEILADANREPSTLLTLLAALPLSLVVTTNFDRLFERAVERAEEASWSLSPDDLVGAKAFVSKLRDGAEAVSLHLRDQLSAATRQDVAAFDGQSEPAAALVVTVAGELDAVIHAPGLYDQQRFVTVHYGEETRRLISAGGPTLRLNRLLLEDAYPDELKRSRQPHQLVVQPVEGFSETEGKRLRDNPPGEDVLVIYKIHGSFSGVPALHAGGACVVITEEDYIQFLTVIDRGVEGVPTHIKSRLALGTMLFLGYSLDDWDFRALHKVLVDPLSRNQRRAAFAIQWRPPKFWVDYWKSKGVNIYDCDVYDFAEDLERLYVAKYGSLSARKLSRS